MLATDLMTLVPLIGMTLLRLGVPILAMGLFSAALKRIAPEASEKDPVGARHLFAVDCTAPQPTEPLISPVAQ
jgi:hypothetical protein